MSTQKDTEKKPTTSDFSLDFEKPEERRNGYYRFKYVRQRHIVVAFVLVILSVSFMQKG